MKWKIEKTCRKGEAPRARSGHRIVYYNGQIFTFGGYNPESTAEQLFKELWKFNLITKTWQSIKITGDIPNTLASHTGKSFSEALIFASTNLQYDDRLFIELQVQYMKIPSSNLGRTCCVQKLFLTFRMFSPCSAKRRASDKDLPVQGILMECVG